MLKLTYCVSLYIMIFVCTMVGSNQPRPTPRKLVCWYDSQDSRGQVTNVGDVVKLECYPGYVLSDGSGQTTKLAKCDGSYTEMLDLCVHIASYSCEHGFHPAGVMFSVCTEYGTWTPVQPCIRTNCGKPLSLPNMKVDVNDTYMFSKASYSCEHGYHPVGVSVSVCQEFGIWTPVQPCIKTTCEMQPPPPDTLINVHYHCNGTCGLGDSVTYGCTELGYNIKGNATKYCMSDGKWTEGTQTCHKIDCGVLNHPLNGSVDLSNGTTYESQAIYSCRSGYYLQGTYERTCGADGKWSDSDPVCETLTCLNCKDMSHPYLCDTVMRCSDKQVCYLETYITNGGQVKYNSGCVDSQQCSSLKSGINKRSAECVHCCSFHLCNANGCGSDGLPSPDKRGPLCYDCSYFSNMDECKTVKLCAQDEVCSIEKHDWGGVYDHYTTKCHSKQCITHKRSSNRSISSAQTSRATPVCQNCCRSDLCNTKCNMRSQNGAEVPIIG